jgi:3-dehydroquinate synthase
MFAFGNHHLDRQSYVLAIGGGAVLDMIGFVAALVHRGLRLIRMPTTVLAQNDAGVGVKNGMNEHGMKNFIGTFAPPFAVINDYALLKTLPDEHWLGGVSEAFKVAIIKDRDFFDFLCNNAASIGRRDQATMEELVRRCAILHLDHIAGNGDPFEFGTARPLDFGHWSAHKLETLSNFRIPHGQAVAAGIALDSYYAMKKGLIRNSDLGRILCGITETGLAVWYPEMGERDAAGALKIIVGLDEFREHLGGQLTITLPDGIGKKCEVHHVDVGLVEEGLFFLRDFADGKNAADGERIVG